MKERKKKQHTLQYHRLSIRTATTVATRRHHRHIYIYTGMGVWYAYINTEWLQFSIYCTYSLNLLFDTLFFYFFSSSSSFDVSHFFLSFVHLCVVCCTSYFYCMHMHNTHACAYCGCLLLFVLFSFSSCECCGLLFSLSLSLSARLCLALSFCRREQTVTVSQWGSPWCCL